MKKGEGIKISTLVLSEIPKITIPFIRLVNCWVISPEKFLIYYLSSFS